MVLPERFARVRVSDLHPDTLLTEVTRDYLQHFWEAFDAGVAPVFVGRPGTGKTTAAAVVARYAWQVGDVDTEFVVVPDLTAQIEFDRFSEETRARLLRLRDVPLLVLDDAHVIPNAQSASAAALTSVVSARWNARRPTLWTANFDLQAGREWAVIYRHFGPVLGRRIEDGSAGYRVLLT